MPAPGTSHAVRPPRAFAALALAFCLLLAAARPGLFAAGGPGIASACGCKPGASCCLLLAKLGKKCCSHPHGKKSAGRCSLGPGGGEAPGVPAPRGLASPKAMTLAGPRPIPLVPQSLRPPGDHAAPSLPGREPPDPPPRFS